MPDGDRFERALRGPWRLPYRLAAAGSPPERVAERLSASCLGLVSEDIALCAQKTMTALDSALAQHAMPLFNGELRGTAFEWLTRSLDRIASEHHFDELAQSCGRAAARCFIGVENQPHIGEVELEHRFACELMSEMAERHFFPRVRERIAEDTGRDSVAQRNWEAHVLRCMAESALNFSEALFANAARRQTKRHVRAAHAPSFDWKRLNEPLHVLGA
jgi:hypothetical protein